MREPIDLINSLTCLGGTMRAACVVACLLFGISGPSLAQDQTDQDTNQASSAAAEPAREPTFREQVRDSLRQQLEARSGETESSRRERLKEEAQKNADTFRLTIDLNALEALESDMDISYFKVLVRGALPLFGQLERLRFCDRDAIRAAERELAQLKQENLNTGEFEKARSGIDRRMESTREDCARRIEGMREEIRYSVESAMLQFTGVRDLARPGAVEKLRAIVGEIRGDRSFLENVGGNFENIGHLDGDIQNKVRLIFASNETSKSGRSYLPD